MTATIEVQKRDFSKNPRELRRDGIIPATVYGNVKEPVSIQFNAREFRAKYKSVTSIIELKEEKQSFKVLVKNIQVNPINYDDILNVEFYNIDEKKPVKVSVPVTLVGESPAVKARGRMVNPIREIRVECLPEDIPSSIDVDMTQLKEFGNLFTVDTINYPEGVKPIIARDSVVIKVKAPKGGK